MDLLQIDRNHIWHPFTQHQGAPAPLLVKRAKGSLLYLDDGRTLIDAISSWWVNLHGHCHPYLNAALADQLENHEQVIFAGLTHEPAIELSKRLIPLLPAGLNRIFFSDNGSCAVEAALKLALQYWHNIGKPRHKFITFANGYHGDTFGAMGVSKRSDFCAPFAPLMFEVFTIDAPVRGNKPQRSLEQLDALLRDHADEIAGFIYEPVVQGTAGLVMQDIEVLDSLIARVQQAGILCIADEIMTGFGRTGPLFASHLMTSKPDIMCLGKGLTGGMLPMSMVVAREFIFEAFLSDSKSKAFLHGHSFTGNSLGCRAGLASLDLLLKDECSEARRRIESEHRRFKEETEALPEGAWFNDIRVQGTILACELKTSEETGYFNSLRDTMEAYFLEQGVLLRPLGNVVYVLPPYCISNEELAQVYGAIRGFVRRHFL